LRAAARIISIQTKCLRSKNGLTSRTTVLGHIPQRYGTAASEPLQESSASKQNAYGRKAV
ncbi:MAG: hypothetical protein NC453_12700, partial [Muribaculum sp.]|nr:hypothetical protein [Muribaculum sp.]